MHAVTSVAQQAAAAPTPDAPPCPPAASEESGGEGGAAGAAVGGAPGQLVREEEREEGGVGMGVYMAYLTQVRGGAVIPIILLSLLAYQSSQVAANYWLSYATTPAHAVPPPALIRVYAWLTLSGVLFVLIRTAAVNYVGIATAQGFFLAMLRSLFRAPMAFFDSTPTGRILSRASSDQTSLDLDLAQAFSGAIRNLFEMGAILVVTASITPQMLVAAVPCLGGVVALQRYYLRSSRVCKTRYLKT